MDYELEIPKRTKEQRFLSKSLFYAAIWFLAVAIFTIIAEYVFGEFKFITREFQSTFDFPHYFIGFRDQASNPAVYDDVLRQVWLFWGMVGLFFVSMLLWVIFGLMISKRSHGVLNTFFGFNTLLNASSLAMIFVLIQGFEASFIFMALGLITLMQAITGLFTTDHNNFIPQYVAGTLVAILLVAFAIVNYYNSLIPAYHPEAQPDLDTNSLWIIIVSSLIMSQWSWLEMRVFRRTARWEKIYDYHEEIEYRAVFVLALRYIIEMPIIPFYIPSSFRKDNL